MSKKRNLIEVNTDVYFKNNIFAKAIQYSEQIGNVKGMESLISAINEKQEMYIGERNVFVREKNDAIKIKLEKAKEWRKKNRIALAVLLAIALFSILIDSLLSVPVLICCLIYFVIYAIYDDTRAKYDHEVSGAIKQAENICRKYDMDAQNFYQRVDGLYLASLEPAHRESVMMRRDQERHHQEQMREQREHNRRIEEEQRKTRIAQEELLRIEKEREERRRGY